MKKIILYLQFILFPAICFAQRSIVSYPYADSANSETFLFGSQADQGNHQFQYSILDIYHAMVPYLDTTGGINIYNHDGQLATSRAVDFNKKVLTFNNIGEFIGYYPSGAQQFVMDTFQRFIFYDQSANQLFNFNANSIALQTNNQIIIQTNGNAGSSNIPMLVASADSVGKTTTITNVINYVTTKTGTYNVGAYLNITSVTGSSVVINVTFTDIHNNTQTQALTSGSSTGFAFSTDYKIRAKIGTHIIVAATVTGLSITYDCGTTLFQLY